MPARPSSKKKASKWKSIVGAPGDEVDSEDKEKMKVKTVPLTIQRVVNKPDIEVNKLSPMEIKAMHKLY